MICHAFSRISLFACVVVHGAAFVFIWSMLEMTREIKDMDQLSGTDWLSLDVD